MRLPGQKEKAAASYGSFSGSRECFVKQELLKQVFSMVEMRQGKDVEDGSRLVLADTICNKEIEAGAKIELQVSEN